MGSAHLRYSNLGNRVTNVNGNERRFSDSHRIPGAHRTRDAARDAADWPGTVQAIARPTRRHLAPAALAGDDRQVRADELASHALGRSTAGRSSRAWRVGPASQVGW